MRTMKRSPSAVVTAWAFAENALTDDRIALATREDAGVKFGLILLAMVILLYGAGIAIQLRAQRRPLAESTRRRIGIAAIAVVASLPLTTAHTSSEFPNARH